MRRARGLHALTIFLALAACGSEAGTDAPEAPSTTLPATTPTSTSASAAGASAAAVASAGAAAKPTTAPPAALPTNAGSASPRNSAGAAAPPPAAMAGSPAAPSGDTAGAAGAAAGGEPGVPCLVSKALANSCHRCHGPVPANGAPMSLVSLADFQVVSVSGKPKVPKYQLALMRMDGSRGPQMPPVGSPLTEEDKKTLIDWLTDGAPAADSGDAATCL